MNASDVRGAPDVQDGQIADSGNFSERLLRVRGDALFAFNARATLVTCGVNKIESIFRDVNRRTRVKVPCLVVGEEGAIGICTMCRLVSFGDPHCACLLQGCLVAQRPLMRRPVVVSFGNMGARSGGRARSDKLARPPHAPFVFVGNSGLYSETPAHTSHFSGIVLSAHQPQHPGGRYGRLECIIIVCKTWAWLIFMCTIHQQRSCWHPKQHEQHWLLKHHTSHYKTDSQRGQT